MKTFEQWWAEYWKESYSTFGVNESQVWLIHLPMMEMAKAAWEASALEMKDQLEHERNNVDNLRQQVEDVEKYQNRLKKEQQERIQRVRLILRQHDIEIEIRTGYHIDDNEITFGFVYQGEMIMYENIEEFKMN